MTALGAVLAGYKTSDGHVVALDVTAPENRFYAEIRPVTELWDPEAMAVGVFTEFDSEKAKTDPDGSLRRKHILEVGEHPEKAMNKFAIWVEELKLIHETQRVVFAAYPLGYDWMWTYWYLMRYSATGSPFGHSRHIDIKTLFSEKSKNLITRSTKRSIPCKLHSKLPHTHLAVQDAAEQGELLINILKWDNNS